MRFKKLNKPRMVFADKAAPKNRPRFYRVVHVWSQDGKETELYETTETGYYDRFAKPIVRERGHVRPRRVLKWIA